MAGGSSGATSGAILGLVLVLLFQQFGYLDFSSNLVNALVVLIVVMAVLGVIFGLLGRVLKGRAIRKAEAGQNATPPVETPAASPPAK
ncbi:MAG TPA: hypothetical protein VK424_08760 [Thermoplasmata archaeon]|nr:hypothetical protein [Thermoplasmata archaeon]